MNRLSIQAILGFTFVLGGVATASQPGTEAIVGKWLAKAVTPHGPLELELEIKMEGTQLVGTLKGFQGAVPLTNLQFADRNLSMEIELGGATLKLTGVLSNGIFDGKFAQLGTDFQGTWAAERTASQAPAKPGGVLGAWDTVAVTSNGELAMVLDLKQEGGKLGGTLSSGMGAAPVLAASFAENRLQFDVEIGGNTYRVNADFIEGKLQGKWSAVGGTGSGAWRASPKAAAQAAAEAAAIPSAILGSWDSVAATPNGDMQSILDLKQDGGRLTGTIGSDMGSIGILSPSFKDDKLQFEIEFGGGTYRIQADLKGDTLTGKWSAVGGTDSGAWSAKRKAPSPAASPAILLDGAWNSVAVTPEGSELAFQVVLKQEGSVVTGNAVSPEGSIPLQQGKFEGEALNFLIEYEGAAYRVEARLVDGRLKGKWSAVSGSDTGAWAAERKTAP